MNNIEGIAIETTAMMLESAEGIIDTQFGTGYAEKHPVITAGYIQATAIVYAVQKLTNALSQDVEGIRFQLERLGGALDRSSN